jgi:tight adherence protein B
MPGMTMLLLLAGILGAAMLAFGALAGPNAGKQVTRRLEDLRERHSRSTEVAAQAQLKRIFSQRKNKGDGVAKRFIPNPALLQLRLSQTGYTWTLAQYLMASAGLALVIIFLLIFKGLPPLYALPFGMLVGVGLPHYVVEQADQAARRQVHGALPDAIELMVRGLRSGLPISETIGIVAEELPGPVGNEFRQVADKMKIGRTMDAALQETATGSARPNSSSS